MIGLYIHIPFCIKKCFYCNFYSVTNYNNYLIKYIYSLEKHMEQYKINNKKIKISTIYIGGGTPSLLPNYLIEYLFNCISYNFDICNCKEITIEINPGTVNNDKLKFYKKIKINRLSIGVQSFNDRILRQLGRIHLKKDSYKTIELAKKNGFKNISIDLIYGIPGQTISDLIYDLNESFKINVNHISYYGLSI